MLEHGGLICTVITLIDTDPGQTDPGNGVASQREGRVLNRGDGTK